MARFPTSKAFSSPFALTFELGLPGLRIGRVGRDMLLSRFRFSRLGLGFLCFPFGQIRTVVKEMPSFLAISTPHFLVLRSTLGLGLDSALASVSFSIVGLGSLFGLGVRHDGYTSNFLRA